MNALKLPIRIPLSITRKWLYLVIWFVSVIILLPISILIYSYFYKVLIPDSIYSIRPDISHPENTYLQFDSVKPITNHEIVYDLVLKTSITCQTGNNQVHSIPYKVYHEQNKQLEVWSQGQFIYDCDIRNIYSENNWFIPFNLRYWVPPIIVNNFKTLTNVKKIGSINSKDLFKVFPKFNERTFSGTYEGNLKIEFDYPLKNLIEVQFVTNWNGLRYYLINYSLICLVIGISFIWSLNCTICFFTSLLVWYKFTQNLTSENKIKSL